MKKISLTIFVLILFTLIGHSQEEEKNFGIKFSGFVKGDYFFDTRQTVDAREGHFLLWPAAKSLDAEGKDINAAPSYNSLAVQTRLKGAIKGPDAFGAKTSGIVEGAFFGHTNADVNGFRLRHAFVNFDWGETELLAGQYWHPMFVTGCFPGVVSFNTGSPFQPFSRNPQLRLTQHFGGLNLVLAAISQRDFTSAGGSSVLRNSGIPDMQLQLSYSSKNEETGQALLAGIGGGYKLLKPNLSITMQDSLGTEATHKTYETIGSYSAQAFFKFKIPEITFKLEGTYGQNMYDVLFISSYAITGYDGFDPEYTNFSNYSVWTDIHTNGSKIQGGLFAGYTQTLGADKNITTSGIAGSRSNIDHVYRIASRVIFNSGKARFAGEVEYTTAAFGTPDVDGIPIDPEEVSNLRFLLGVYYFF